MTVPRLSLNDGARIPQLGLGVLHLDDAASTVEHALRLGYRHIDTASLYGNEAEVGRGIRASGVPRDEVFVTTKLHNPDQGFERAIAAFDTSLRLLDTDYVDLYLIHWPAPRRDAYVDTWRALVELRDRGLVRSIGVSNFRAADLERIVAEVGVIPAVNQIELHPTFGQRELRLLHAQLGIVTEAWSPLGNGADLTEPVVGEVAAAHDRSPAQVILRWHLQQGIVVFPKSDRPERLTQNLAVFDFELDEAEMDAITALDRGNRLGGHPDLIFE